MQSLSVTELVARLRRAVEVEVGEQRVQGEIGSCKMAGSGHIYFTLKDEASQLQCVLYRFQANSCRVRLREGLQVELAGRATVWEGRGSLQFIVSRVQEAGMGTLQQRFEQLKLKLEREGLFSPARKRPLPAVPQSVGLITSATGAVIEDMRHRLSERAPWMQAYLLPVQVQGKGAEHGIARAIQLWGAPEAHGLPRVDYLIVARGGGSMEDLWCFNEEVVARAIAESPIPVVSAVGHETDFTIADFVADLRAPTPTAAIALATPDAAALAARYAQPGLALRRRLTRALELAQLRLRAAEQGKLARPVEALAPFTQKLDVLEEELRRAARERLEQSRHALDMAAARLSVRTLRAAHTAREERLTALHRSLLQSARMRLQSRSARRNALEGGLRAADPQNALERGFALVSGADGKLVRDAAALHEGELMKLRFGRGSADARVERLSLSGGGTPPDPACDTPGRCPKVSRAMPKRPARQ